MEALMKINVKVPVLPTELKEYFGEYRACFYDGWCGEPVAWGFRVRRHLGDFLWAKASQLGELECNHGYPAEWYLITHRITISEAEKKYGKPTACEVGVRGGVKSITYGEKVFCSPSLMSHPYAREWYESNKERLNVEYQKKRKYEKRRKAAANKYGFSY